VFRNPGELSPAMTEQDLPAAALQHTKAPERAAFLA
jgi:hypothetical protein